VLVCVSVCVCSVYVRLGKVEESAKSRQRFTDLLATFLNYFTIRLTPTRA
jgi:hypothetical protein